MPALFQRGWATLIPPDLTHGGSIIELHDGVRGRDLIFGCGVKANDIWDGDRRVFANEMHGHDLRL